MRAASPTKPTQRAPGNGPTLAARNAELALEARAQRHIASMELALAETLARDAVAHSCCFARAGRHGCARCCWALWVNDDLRAGHPRFTTIVEPQPPEDTIELLNTYYTLMFDAISGQGRDVNPMIGDGLMAVFGAPLPLPEPPLAAVQAALDMIEMIELFNAESAASNQAPIAIAIGIASGEVIAGYTGTQARAPYTCVGDTVNLAARLEAHNKASGQAVLIDEPTHAALAGRVATTALGPIVISGRPITVPVFAVKAQP